MSSRTARDLLVWLHVLTSVAWMSQALALVALQAYTLSTRDPAGLAMARVLDHTVLMHLANASAFTGIMLAAMTPWGFFRYWWVLLKFVITLTQLYLGIFVLSGQLQRGAIGPLSVAGASLMVSAIAFQAWLSIAKPWKRTPWAASVKPPTAPVWLLLAACALPFADYALTWALLGAPVPMVQLLAVVVYPAYRWFSNRSDG
ncbi:hypothetical protein D5S17_24065 [Pseudonocardiaceae bacterium YIM PH 21723]|nr:hypothetical protein D5S17_24065 [Pseudonocardiaceae bacterium YIM PH 21723]